MLLSAILEHMSQKSPPPPPILENLKGLFKSPSHSSMQFPLLEQYSLPQPPGWTFNPDEARTLGAFPCCSWPGKQQGQAKCGRGAEGQVLVSQRKRPVRGLLGPVEA